MKILKNVTHKEGVVEVEFFEGDELREALREAAERVDGGIHVAQFSAALYAVGNAAQVCQNNNIRLYIYV